jgi:hypothetical protein
LPRSWTSSLRAGLVLAALATAAVPAHAAQETTRVFALQPKLDLAWMESRESFHDKLFGLADRTLRGPGRPLIQDGADDFASHLRPDGRNLVTLPEDTGLWAVFTGQRASDARASGSIVGAIVTLFTSYSPQMSYYGQKYPDVASRSPQTRLLALALTDTLARVAVETFSEMAAKYHVWLEAGIDMTQDWHVVCVGPDAYPPQEPCDEVNPGKVAMLGDPGEPDRGYAYEALSPDASNIALVFGPDGRLVSKQVKEYITPIELGTDESQLAALDLVPGSVTSGLSPVATSVGTLGFVTSKDAWMPDVVDKLEAGHVDILVQPEFFSGDLAANDGMWAADTLKASGYNDLLRDPGFIAMVLPQLVGNIFDFSADQQSHIVTRVGGVTPRQTGDTGSLIGQPPAPGLTAVAPWAVPDPIRPDEPFPERRKRLREVGKALAPGSGVACPDPAKPGPCENGNVETVVWQDVPVGMPGFKRFRGKRTRSVFSRAKPLTGARMEEHHVTAALAGRYGAIAFVRQFGDVDHIWVATTTDGGRHWSRARVAEASGDSFQRWPALAVSRKGKLTLAWVEQEGPRSRVFYSQAKIAGHVWLGPPRLLDSGAPATADQWKVALAQGNGDVVHAAYVDTRARFKKGGLPQAGLYYRRIAAGAAGPAERLDEGPPKPLATKLDNAWAPSVAVRGRDVLVAWLDFMHYDWDVLSRLSHDSGRTFAQQVSSNREPDDVEDLSDSPSALFVKGGPLIAWTDFHKRDSAETTPHPMYDTYIAPPGKAPEQVDPYGARHVSTFWPSACTAGADALVAFQDSSTGVGRIRIVRMRAGTKRGHARAVNDTSANAYRPALACSGRRAIVAWEDARDGVTRVYTASATTRRIR